MLEPTAREERLSQWARDLLRNLRAEVRAATDRAKTAEQAAEQARRLSRVDAAITYDAPDGQTYGLPNVSIVQIGEVEAELTSNGVLLCTIGRLVVEPVSRNSIRIRSVL